MLSDFRYSLRVLFKNPGFTVAAVIVLALGVGANTAIFSLLNAVLLQRLPYRDPARLVYVWESRSGAGEDMRPVATGNFFDWRTRTSVFEDVGWSRDATFNLTGEGEPENLIGYRFSPNFLSVLGVQPALGRGFAPDEAQPGKDHVVILSDKLWRSRFAADPNIVGRRLTLHGEPYEVIGVMPPTFNHPQDTRLWAPLTLPPGVEAQRDFTALRLVGRLRPHATAADAQRELTGIYTQMARQYPATNEGVGVKVVPYREVVIGESRTPLLVLAGAVGFVLLIACANLANLLLARAVARQKELAIRVALGAGRARVLRQVLIESCLLGLGGGVVGLVFAAWSVNGLVSMFPQTISNLPLPRLTAVPIDQRVAIFTLAVSLAAGLLFGLLPAMYTSRPDLSRWLKEGRGTSAPAGGRLRSALVVSEIALSMLLLVGAMLMIKSFRHLQSSELGFQPDRVLSLRIMLPAYKYRERDRVRAFASGVLDRVRALPGIESAGITNYLPLSGWWGTREFRVDGKPAPKPGEEPTADARVATPGYFSTLGIRLVRGRDFTDADGPDSPPIVIVNQTLARRYWPGEEPVGRRLIVDTPAGPTAWEVVGVVNDVKSFGLQEATHAELFRPFAQEPSGLVGLVVRTAGDPDAQANPVRRTVWEVDKDQPVSYVMSMADLATESLAFERVSTLLVAAFAALALVLAAVGVYGVLAYLVTQRRREIGIRLALGAERRSVLVMIVRQALSLAMMGGIGGLALAFALSRALQSMLYGVTPADPLSFALAVVLVPSVAAAASALPAWRAMRVDPITALREE